MVQRLSEVWTPCLILEDSAPDFEQHLATAITEGIRVLLIVRNPDSVFNYLFTYNYWGADKGQLRLPVGHRGDYYKVHKDFRICCFLDEDAPRARELRKLIIESQGYWILKRLE
jgi:hypothetical protein